MLYVLHVSTSTFFMLLPQGIERGVSACPLVPTVAARVSMSRVLRMTNPTEIIGAASGIWLTGTHPWACWLSIHVARTSDMWGSFRDCKGSPLIDLHFAGDPNADGKFLSWGLEGLGAL